MLKIANWQCRESHASTQNLSGANKFPSGNTRYSPSQHKSIPATMETIPPNQLRRCAAAKPPPPCHYHLIVAPSTVTTAPKSAFDKSGRTSNHTASGLTDSMTSCKHQALNFISLPNCHAVLLLHPLSTKRFSPTLTLQSVELNLPCCHFCSSSGV